MAPQSGAQDNVPETVLKLAWKLLWTKGTPFYLPTIILNGLDQGGHPLPPLAARPVKDLGPIALFDKDPWGTVSITLSDASVAGLDSIGDQGFTFDSATSTFTAKISFSSLVFAGRYGVEGSGLAGCAVAGATGLLGLFPTRAIAAEGGNDFDDEHLVLARNYQAQLATSPGGLKLVGHYYDNNDAMNEIVRGKTFFSETFPTAITNGKTSRIFADQTTLAAKSPDDPARPVGDPTYRLHAFKMQLAFAHSAQDLYQQTNDPKYIEAGKARDEFFQQTNSGPVQGETTVGNVMTVVSKTDPNEARRIATTTRVLEPEYEAAAREIDAAHHAWKAANDTRSYSELRARSNSLGSGTFMDHFGVPSLSISGTVAVSGSGPDVKLVLTLTQLNSNLPQIDINLSTSLPNTLYDELVRSLANAGFVKDLLRSNVNDALGEKSTLNYLSSTVNAAIAKVLS